MGAEWRTLQNGVLRLITDKALSGFVSVPEVGQTTQKENCLVQNWTAGFLSVWETIVELHHL